MSWRYEFVNKVPILTASPEEATAIVKDTGSVTAHPSQKLAGKHRRTGNTDWLWYFTYHWSNIGVEYASHMMVPSATNTKRFNGLSQIIRMNNQGSQWKMDIFQRVKIMWRTQTTSLPSVKTAEWPEGIILLLQTHSITKCFTQRHNKGAHPRYHNNLHLQPLKNYYA